MSRTISSARCCGFNEALANGEPRWIHPVTQPDQRGSPAVLRCDRLDGRGKRIPVLATERRVRLIDDGGRELTLEVDGPVVRVADAEGGLIDRRRDLRDLRDLENLMQLIDVEVRRLWLSPCRRAAEPPSLAKSPGVRPCPLRPGCYSSTARPSPGTVCG